MAIQATAMIAVVVLSSFSTPCYSKGGSGEDTYALWFKTANLRASSCIMVRPISKTQKHRALDSSTLNTILNKQMQHLEPLEHPSSAFDVFELLGQSPDALEEALTEYCPRGIEKEWEKQTLSEYVVSAERQVRTTDEVVKLVDSGDPKNRIDVVLMGDGYTEDERDEFFADMKRMTNDMFQAQTFAPYLPLFNVWALFRPSAESGLGSEGRPKDTAFGLYREGTELRAVFCSKSWAARRACHAVGPYACDFPSLIANDPYYGGLGGEFTISTKSETSGTIVLRHEMGHNFGRTS